MNASTLGAWTRVKNVDWIATDKPRVSSLRNLSVTMFKSAKTGSPHISRVVDKSCRDVLLLQLSGLVGT